MRYSVKLFTAILLLLSLTLAVSGNLLMFSSFAQARTQAVEQARHDFRLLEYTAVSAGLTSSGIRVADMVGVLTQLEGEHSSRIRLKEDSTLLYESRGEAAAFDDTLLSHASRDACSSRLLTDGAGAHYIQISGYLPVTGPSISLDGIFSIEEPYRTLRSQRAIYSRVFTVMVLAGIGIAVLLQIFLTRPLKKLSSAARVIADGDFSVRAEEKGHDEFAALAADFNRMADRLTEETERQKAFTGAFAHEMKTPMTSIIGYADLLRSRTLDEETRAQAANIIFTEGRRLEKLSLKLLDLLVLQRRDFPLSRQELSRLVRDTAAEVRPELEKQGISILCHVQAGYVPMEPDLMKTLLLNLIDNARKAMPEGGSVEILQRITEDGFTLSVRDTGYGIPKEEIDRLTEAFYRVDKSRSRAQGGVGLGLSICREIASLHHGKLTFASTPGEGTTVTLTVRREKT